jgi:hypothetical protein
MSPRCALYRLEAGHTDAMIERAAWSGLRSHLQRRRTWTSGATLQRNHMDERVERRPQPDRACRERVGKRMRRAILGRCRRKHAAGDRTAIRQRVVLSTARIAVGAVRARDAKRIAERIEHWRCIDGPQRKGAQHGLKHEHVGRDKRDAQPPGHEPEMPQLGPSEVTLLAAPLPFENSLLLLRARCAVLTRGREDRAWHEAVPPARNAGRRADCFGSLQFHSHVDGLPHQPTRARRSWITASTRICAISPRRASVMGSDRKMSPRGVRRRPRSRQFR